MPVHRGTTTKNGKKVGYYQWGTQGKRYHYTLGSESSRKRARAKAQKQGRAARAHGYKG